MADQETKDAIQKILQAQSGTGESPDRTLRKAQMWLGAACMLAAFVLAFVLISKGPPAPNSAVKEETLAEAVTAGASAAPQPATEAGANSSSEGASGASSTGAALLAADPPAGQEAGGPAPGDDTGTGDESSGSEPAPGGEEPAVETPSPEGLDALTSHLDEQAPWVFAIIALLVGSFLTAGQSISFGKKE